MDFDLNEDAGNEFDLNIYPEEDNNWQLFVTREK